MEYVCSLFLSNDSISLMQEEEICFIFPPWHPAVNNYSYTTYKVKNLVNFCDLVLSTFLSHVIPFTFC